jgi:hypothetical protein
MSVGTLVDILDIRRIPSDESFSKVDKGTFDSLRVTFQSSFTPSNDSLSDVNDVSQVSRAVTKPVYYSPLTSRLEQTTIAVVLERSRSW